MIFMSELSTQIEFLYGIGAGFVACAVVSFFVIRMAIAAHKGQEAEAKTRLLSDVEHLQDDIDSMRDELHEKNKTIEALQEARTRLATSLEVERESIAKQLDTVEKAKQDLSNMFKAIGKDALKENNQMFLDLAKQNLETLQVKSSEALEKKRQAIEELVKPVSESLNKMDEKINLLEKERKGAYEGITQQIKFMQEGQQKLQNETKHLVSALRSPATKGQWGEMHLKNTVKMAGLVEHVDFVEQDSFKEEGKTKRPDMVVHMPGGQKIIVDAKAPIDAYHDALAEDLSPEERDAKLERLARLVREHMKGLASKAYWDQFESPEFVVMFLPNEGFFSAAVEKDPSLLQYGIEQKVIPASPTTLVALLRAVGYGWQQEKIADNAREISDLGSELYRRLSTFGDHLQKVGNGLNSALKAYNGAVGSLEGSVLPSARRFQDLHVTSKQRDIPDLKALEVTPRALSAPEFIDVADDDAESNDTKKRTKGA